MRINRVRLMSVGLAALAACDAGTAPTTTEETASSRPALAGAGGLDLMAAGNYRVIAPEEVFGVEIGGTFTFDARKDASGAEAGHFRYDEIYPDQVLTYEGIVTCINVYDGTRAKIGGVITETNDPAFPPGNFLWWQTKDNGLSEADWSSLAGGGNEEANEAFCNSPNLPRFGPFPVLQGNSEVRDF